MLSRFLPLVFALGCSDALEECLGICNGCCTDAGECVAGTTEDACGLGSELCVECPSGQECEIQELGGGICQESVEEVGDTEG